MPINIPKGLRGLDGINSLSSEEYDSFVARNRDLIAQHRYDPRYIAGLYDNTMFVNKYGMAKFNSMPDPYMRNAFYHHDIINDEFTRLYSPFKEDGTRDNTLGAGSQWDRINSMSDDGKLKLMESGWKTASEFEDFWKKHLDKAGFEEKNYNNIGEFALDQLLKGGKKWVDLMWTKGALNALNFEDEYTGDLKSYALQQIGGPDAAKSYLADKNNALLDKIYEEDSEDRTKQYDSEVADVYQATLSLSDDDVKDAFTKAIKTDLKNGILGVPDYYSRYGDGSDPSSEMEDFSIDDMRKVIAKQAVYSQYMSPGAVSAALNKEAKEYIYEHQGAIKTAYLGARDFSIAVGSYTADKINGVYQSTLMARDAYDDYQKQHRAIGTDEDGNPMTLEDVFGEEGERSGKPIVWVNEAGQVVHPSDFGLKNFVETSKEGIKGYRDKDGDFHRVHQVEMDRSTLHLMGKNFDGSNIDSGWKYYLNPDMWTKAETYGTTDREKQAMYENIGSSPYQIAWKPGEDSNFWYEAFKMSTFGIADGIAVMIPWGIGKAGTVMKTSQALGKAGKAFGRVTEFAGKTLANPKLQGVLGAEGIAYAYERGAFQETLANSLSLAEEAMLEKSREEVYAQLQENKAFKAQADKTIDAMVSEQLREAKAAGIPVDLEQLKKEAREVVYENLVNQKFEQNKGTKEYADMIDGASSAAGKAALLTFVPEAVKYGLVNTFGFRKFWYTNPEAKASAASKMFKGIKEVTTKEGKQRLAKDASKFLTTKDKWKQLGKAAGSQIWGGAWTNGSDDMMVDAAEMVAKDGYTRYLHGLDDGDAMATTYGFSDGVYSYFNGLMDSMGQETTWRAAAIGGAGSVMSFSPNFANIVHYATKEGRKVFEDSFQKRVKRDAEGKKVLGEDGKPIYENISWKENWRERAAHFVNNGILNTYYGNKQSERDLWNHIDFVNDILDKHDDFKIVEKLIASDISKENAANTGDRMTTWFVNAIEAVNTLNNLGNGIDDASTISSVVRNTKSLLQRAAKMQFDGKKSLLSFGRNNEGLTEQEAHSLLQQYYAMNPGLARSEGNSLKGLYHIAENAQKLIKASDALDESEKQIQKLEKSEGIKIPWQVRDKMKMDFALNEHWENRVAQMKEEINDSSSTETELSSEDRIATVGGKVGAQSFIKTYERQEKELYTELMEAQRESELKNKKLNKAKAEVKEAKDAESKLKAKEKAEDLNAEYESSKQRETYIKDTIKSTQAKRAELENALKAVDENATTFDNFRSDKVLSSNEIFNLDAVTRARMMNPYNRGLYSEEQVAEIEKLESELQMRDPDALQKIQDISLLTQRIAANKDAYSRMAKNPIAAAHEIETQRSIAAISAASAIDHRNAYLLADAIEEFDSNLRGKEDVTQNQLDEQVFKTLKKTNPKVLNILNREKLVNSKYQRQLEDAISFNTLVEDVVGVVKNAPDAKPKIADGATDAEKEAAVRKAEQWRISALNNISKIVERATDRDSLLAELEKARDDMRNAPIGRALDYLLNELLRIGYQRDAVTLESIAERRVREKKLSDKREELRKKVEEEAKVAAEKAAAVAKERRKREAEEKRRQHQETIQKAVNVYLKKYHAFSPVHVIDIYSDADIRKVLGDDLTDEDINGVREYLKNRKTPSTFSYDKKQIFIFADNIDAVDIEEALFHENIHRGLQQYYGDGIVELADAFWDSTSPSPEIEEKNKKAISERYSQNPTRIKEEYFTHLLSNAMVTGKVDNILSRLSKEHQEVIDNILKNTGYDKARESGERNTEEETSEEEEHRGADEKSGTLRKSRYPARVVKGSPWGQLVSTMMDEDAEAGTVESLSLPIEEGGSIKTAPLKITLSKLHSPKIIFSLDGKVISIRLPEGSWEYSNTSKSTPTETLKNNNIEEGSSVMAKRLEKSEDGYWYVEGSFENTDELFTLKLKDDFDLYNAIEEYKKYLDSQYDVGGLEDIHIADIGDSFVGNTGNAAAQVTEAAASGIVAEVSESDGEDIEKGSDVDIEGEDNSVTTLSGNGMSEYYPKPMSDDGLLIHKRGETDNDPMNNYYAWMRNEGIHLQNIIDDELPKILKKHPHIKIKFMAVNGKDNATHDNHLNERLFLVIDYTSDIDRIHNKDNGGVIQSLNQKYLIVGTVGFKRDNERQFEHYLTLMNYTPGNLGIMKSSKGTFFRQHPNERFFIHDAIHTEYVPGSMINGYRARQLENDEHPNTRSILDLLQDKEGSGRNPHKISLGDVVWCLCTYDKPVIINGSIRDCIPPTMQERHAGNIFAMMPSGSGKLVPCYINPLKFNELKEGKLKNRIMQLLSPSGILSMNSDVRKKAISNLSSLLFLDTKKDSILITKKENKISIVRDGKVTRTFNLTDPSFSPGVFMEEIEKMNPRVNITARGLGDYNTLLEYEEAGALNTDYAKFGTAGCSYRIYPVDSNGKMIIPEPPSNASSGISDGNVYGKSATIVIYEGRRMRYQNGQYTHEDGTVIDASIPYNARLISELEINRRIIEGGIISSEYNASTNRDTYILNAGEHPEVVDVDRETKHITVLSEDKAKAFIQKIRDAKSQAERDAKAEAAIKDALEKGLANLEDLTLQDGTFTFDDDGNPIAVVSEDIPLEDLNITDTNFSPVSSSPSSPAGKQVPIPLKTPTSLASPTSLIAPKTDGIASSPTQTFETLSGAPKYRMRVMIALKKKWPDIPGTLKEKTAFLRNKGVEVDAIGTSDEDINAWLHTIECH